MPSQVHSVPSWSPKKNRLRLPAPEFVPAETPAEPAPEQASEEEFVSAAEHFIAADEDGSGALDVEELAQATGTSLEEAAELHAEADTDGDGVVTLSEFIASPAAEKTAALPKPVAPVRRPLAGQQQPAPQQAPPQQRPQPLPQQPWQQQQQQQPNKMAAAATAAAATQQGWPQQQPASTRVASSTSPSCSTNDSLGRALPWMRDRIGPCTGDSALCAASKTSAIGGRCPRCSVRHKLPFLEEQRFVHPNAWALKHT